MLAILLLLSMNQQPANAFMAPSLPLYPRKIHVAIRASSMKMVMSPPPPSPTSFTGMVEKGIVERFGAVEASRVVQSLRLLDQGYEHREYMGPEGLSESSNFHQHAHSYVPGLVPKTFWDVNDFEWCSKLADKYEAIRDEFLSVTSDMDKLKKDGNNVWAGALTDDASSYGEGWRTLVLLDRGTWDPVNTALFPTAAKAIRDSGVPAVEVFFASMQPHTDIKMHSDFTNFVLTSHLALDIPDNGKNKCRLTVGDDTKQWLNGEVTLFDTSIMHDAINESDKTRYILMMRIWHPDLTEPERNALQFTWDCLAIPELVSPDPAERFMAEERVKLLHAFPEIKAKPGFGKKKSAKRKKRSGGKGFGA